MRRRPRKRRTAPKQDEKASNRAGEKNKKVRRRYRQMKVERERVRETFREYTDAYDATDEKIKL